MVMRIATVPSVSTSVMLATACLMLCMNSGEACSSGFSECCNGKCVDTDYIRDGDNDCGDGSDETTPAFQCVAVQFIEVTGACSRQSKINSVYELQGTTASKKPYYQNTEEDVYLYHDPDCSGSGSDGRWIFDDSKPSLTRTSDLDGPDGTCSYKGRQSSDARAPPSGTTTWRLPCSQDSWGDVTLSVSNIDADDVCVADETCSPAACRSWIVQDEANLPNQPFRGTDFNSCKAKCTDTSECVAFSYQPGGGTCYMKGALKPTGTVDGWQTHIRACEDTTAAATTTTKTATTKTTTTTYVAGGDGELEATTANTKDANTPDEVLVQFYIKGRWTETELFFNGADRGSTKRKQFKSAVGATRVRFTINGNDGWAFVQVKFDGITILEHPDGTGEVDLKACDHFFIDGNGCYGPTVDIDTKINELSLSTAMPTHAKFVAIVPTARAGRAVSRATCDAYAKVLNKPLLVTSCSGKSCAPIGCYIYKEESIYWNEDNSGKCSETRKCLDFPNVCTKDHDESCKGRSVPHCFVETPTDPCSECDSTASKCNVKAKASNIADHHSPVSCEDRGLVKVLATYNTFGYCAPYQVSCGGHFADDCYDCNFRGLYERENKGSQWCNGECAWDTRQHLFTRARGFCKTIKRRKS